MLERISIFWIVLLWATITQQVLVFSCPVSYSYTYDWETGKWKGGRVYEAGESVAQEETAIEKVKSDIQQAKSEVKQAMSQVEQAKSEVKQAMSDVEQAMSEIGLAGSGMGQGIIQVIRQIGQGIIQMLSQLAKGISQLSGKITEETRNNSTLKIMQRD